MLDGDVGEGSEGEDGGEDDEGDEAVDGDGDGAGLESGELDAVELLEPDGFAGGEGLHVGIVTGRRDADSLRE
jgi:hypothetical protein